MSSTNTQKREMDWKASSEERLSTDRAEEGSPFCSCTYFDFLQCHMGKQAHFPHRSVINGSSKHKAQNSELMLEGWQPMNKLDPETGLTLTGWFSVSFITTAPAPLSQGLPLAPLEMRLLLAPSFHFPSKTNYPYLAQSNKKLELTHFVQHNRSMTLRTFFEIICLAWPKLISSNVSKWGQRHRLL